jgi:hypothetical protein
MEARNPVGFNFIDGFQQFRGILLRSLGPFLTKCRNWHDGIPLAVLRKAQDVEII